MRYIPKLGWFQPIDSFLSLMFIIALSIALEPLDKLIGEEHFKSYFEMFTKGDMWLNVATTVIGAPILEEYFFRGIIQRDLTNRWGARVGIFGSAFIFAALHFNIVQVVPTLIMGIYLGFVYHRTRYSLITVMVIHALNNLISITALYTGLAEKSISAFIENPLIDKGIYILACIIVFRTILQVSILRNKKG